MTLNELEQIIAQIKQSQGFSISLPSQEAHNLLKGIYTCREALPGALALIKVMKEALETCREGTGCCGQSESRYDEWSVEQALTAYAAFENDVTGERG